MPSDLRTRAIVLRRTNYGESDRILSLLTPEGKQAVIARSVRKEKARLAGNIELFSTIDVVIHRGHSEIGILTGARIIKFYHHFMTDLLSLELAGALLKAIERAADQVTTPEYFSLLEQSLQALDAHANLSVIAAWFNFNLQRAGGEEVNLLRDVDGQPLAPKLCYSWDVAEAALRPDPRGQFGATEIKLLRFLLNHRLASVLKIEQIDQLIAPVYELSKIISNS